MVRKPNVANKKSQQFWLKQEPTLEFDFNLEFTSGRDVKSLPMADYELLAADIYTNLAHAKMLLQVKILSAAEYRQIKKGLMRINSEFQSGKYQLNPKWEDVHMNIERYLTSELNVKAAEKLHTARSRNDQVATDIRIFLRERVTNIAIKSIELSQVMLDLAEREKNTVMPGFTHYQPAMFTSFAHLVAAWVAGELRGIDRLLSSLKLFNYCPLGAGAGYGTSWPIDRKISASLLGFYGPQENTLDAISSRGEMESQIAADMAIAANNWSKIAQDLILFSQPYFGFIKLNSDFVTGSSIMPQKTNPDLAEILRAKASFCHGVLQGVLSTVKALPTGYNRDLQQTKYMLLDLFRELDPAPDILKKALSSITVDRSECLAKCLIGGMEAIEITDFLASRCQLSFRKAYLLVSEAVKLSSKSTLDIKALEDVLKSHRITSVPAGTDWQTIIAPKQSIARRQHLGAPAPKMMEKSLKNSRLRLKQLTKEVFKFKDGYEKSLEKLLA